ncbi:MAG: thioesterase family protein, partial [Alphaproteobacteria bacterium]
LAVDDKKMHIFHRITAAREDTLLATAEQMLLHVDTKAGRTVPADAPILARLQRIAAAHTALPKPDAAGRFVGAPRT